MASKLDQDSVVDRVVELEEKFSFQEELLLQLNDVVAKQAMQIMELASQLKSCKEQIEGLRERDSQPSAAAEDERPPHY